MPSDRSVLERQIEHVELRPFTLDGFHRRLERNRRNRRIVTAAVAVAVAAAGIGGMTRAFMGGSETRPADRALSAFVGEWSSIDYNENGGDTGSGQTMTIRTGEDGVVRIRAHADQTSSVCWERRPGQNPRYVYFGSTMIGTGQLEEATTLVVPSPVVGCPDGGEHRTDGPTRFEEEDSYRLVLDPATDRLYDNLGVVWNRGAPPAHWVGESTEASVDGAGTFAMLYGEVTFRAAEPWNDHIEAYLDPRLFFLIGPGGERESAYIDILVNPLPPDTPCDSLRVPPSAEELVQAIRSNPNLETTAPVTERIGGVGALRMDVRAVPGAPGLCEGDRVGVVSVPGRGSWGGIDHGALGRLYVLDLPGGSARTLAIHITAPDAALFERAVEAAAPILDSFEFHTG